MKVRMFFKKYPECPLATVLSVVLNIAWVVFFIFILVGGYVEIDYAMKFVMLIFWFGGELLIALITDKIAERAMEKKYHLDTVIEEDNWRMK